MLIQIFRCNFALKSDIFASLQRLLTDNSMSHTKPKHETTPKPGMGVQRKNDVAIHLIYIIERFYIKQGENNQQQ